MRPSLLELKKLNAKNKVLLYTSETFLALEFIRQRAVCLYTSDTISVLCICMLQAYSNYMDLYLVLQ